jgi:Plasmid pRiA4b ORF-3-like protein
MSEPSVSSLAIYQLRVVRCGVSPLVWRRLLVASDTSLGELHEILQNAFDWSGEHLHRFFAFALLPFYLLKQQRSGRILLMPFFHSLLISCSVTTAFGTLLCIEKRRFSGNVLPSHSLRRRNSQVIDHHTALGLAKADCGMRCPGGTVKAHDSISSEPRSDVARSPTSKPRR